MRAGWTLLASILLAGITFAVYWPSLHYVPFFDDLNSFEGGGLQQVFLNGFAFAPRWLPYFISAWVDLLFDDPLFAQRCINVALHLATAFVLHGLIRQVADHVAPHPNNRRAAIAATLLFLLHPLAVYAVGYLIQRTILMATLFGLLTLSTYFDGLVTRKKSYFIFSALFYLLSSFSKEHAVLIPAATLALTPLAVTLNRRTWRIVVLPLVLYLPIAVLVTFLAKTTIGAAYEPFAAPMVRVHVGEVSALKLWMLSFMTQCALYFKYLGLMLVPYPGWMSIDMRVPFANSLGEPKYLLAVLALAAYTMLAIRGVLRGRRRGLVGYALLAPLLLFAVEFSTVRIQEPFVLYRTYLWITPLFLVVPAVTQRLPDRFFWPVIMMMALAFAYASSDRLTSFSGGFALWDDAVHKLPEEPVSGKARVYANRGNWNAKRGDLQGAVADFTSALSADSRFKGAYAGRAFAYVKLGDFDSALRDANAFVLLFPEDPYGLTVRSLVFREQGNIEAALQDLERGCDMKSMGACIALNVTKKRYGVPGAALHPQ